MRGRFNRPLTLAVFAVFVLVAVVAVASTGSTPGGSADTRPPSELIFDTFYSLGLVALIPGAALLIYGLMQRKAISEEIASGRYRRTSAIALIIFVAALTGFAYLVRNAEGRFSLFGAFGETGEIGRDGEPVARDASEYDPDAYRAEFAWIPVIVVIALVIVGLVAFALASRRREARETGDTVVAEQLADVLEETLDDLRADPDARRAVIAAYARLERSFAAAGLPRRHQETAEEYVPRVLDGLKVDPAAVRTLTDLFTTAKFSQHPVSDAMKLEAVASLERIRDDLRAAAERGARLAAEHELPEQAATT